MFTVERDIKTLCDFLRLFAGTKHNFWQSWGLQLYLKRDSGKVFSGEFSEILKNTFFHRTRPVAVSNLLSIFRTESSSLSNNIKS